MRRKTPEAWAGLEDPETGQLASALLLDSLMLAESVTRDRGVFRFVLSFKHRRPPADLLRRFLNAQTDDALLEFAKRFGPRAWPSDWSQLRAGYNEPIERWRQYRWEFDYLLKLAADVKADVPIDTDPWAEYEARGIHVPRHATLGKLAGLPPPKTSPEQLRAERRFEAATVVLDRVDALARFSGLRLAVTMVVSTEKRMERFERFDHGVHTGGGFGLSVLGALTDQFEAAVIGAAGPTRCNGCGFWFVPKGRRPAHGRRRFCPTCGRPAAMKVAKATHRAKNRARAARSRR